MLLVVDCEDIVQRALDNHFVVELMESGESEVADLVVPDHTAVVVGLDSNGVYTCASIRRAGFKGPIIGLKTVSSETSLSRLRTEWLENGGDDLLAIPTNFDELVATIKARFRALDGNKEVFRRTTFGNRTICWSREYMVIRIDDQPLDLRPSELRIMLALLDNTGRPLTKETLLAHLPTSQAETVKMIDVIICKLRKKLNSVGINDLVKTRWGQGYIIDK